MKSRTSIKWSLFGALSLLPVTLAFAQSASLPEVGVIPGKYIVVLKPGADRAAVAARHAVQPDFVYTHALHGFAGTVPDARLARLVKDPDVAYVEPDQVATIVGKPGTKPPPPSPSQTIPTGVKRIGLSAINASGIGIAIIDTGIDLTHPDLNVVGNTTFVTATRSGNDDNGHGTHCAGIAAARDNGIGVRGVAPGAQLYAVKVLSRSGSGSYSAVIAGVDWVAARADKIQVANMSLGGPSSTALNDAISKAVAAGIAFCVAAGNDGADASNTSPANCGDALAVSAIVDTDGLCGGTGGATGYGADDTFASFSNFGPFVHIAAPGVNIYSTYKGGSYATMSGTSMAAPHVTGAAALFIAKNPGVQPGVVYDGLIAAGSDQGTSCGFTGDPDNIPEPLVNAGAL